jgi:hypothetical protein
VSTRTGIGGTDHPAIAGELPPVRMSPVRIDGAGVKVLAPEEDDQFQWFVDLFVAEYASEATARPDPSV